MTNGLSLTKPKSNTNNMHEFLIWVLILVIVGVQVVVGLNTFKKIDLFKTIIPDAETFETVRVYIPENQIKDIKIDYILNNLNKFSSPFHNDNVIDLQEYNIDEAESEGDYPEDDTTPLLVAEDPVDYDAMIWIAKENEEKKIKLKMLKSYETLGWKRI